MCEINVMETVQDAKSVVMCFVLCGPLHTSDKGEFNMVDYVESRLLPKRSTLLPMPSTLLLVLATNLQHCEFAVTLWYTSTPTFECCQGICDKLSRSILLPKHSTLLPIWWTSCQCVRGQSDSRLCWLSTKLTVLNSTLSRVCTRLMTATVIIDEPCCFCCLLYARPA